MPELRKDPVSGTWVIFSPERQRRPQFFRPTGEDILTPENCPFCEGNERMTPPEVFSIRDNSDANKPGWRLRVVPNKFPALRVEGHLDKKPDGFYDKISGVGAHEVVIETSSHTKGADELEPDAVAAIFNTFRKRISDLKQDIRFKYINVFKNQGAMAGATISHPHSQIIALPVVPARVKELLATARAHYETKDRCLFCDIIHHEKKHKKRVLLENSDFIVISPYAPRLPFELAIYPKRHSASFEKINKELLPQLAVIFSETVARINNALERPAYNLVLHNAPFDDKYDGHYHWHLELTPIITGTGGFELGTHSYINPVPPEEAIKILNA